MRFEPIVLVFIGIDACILNNRWTSFELLFAHLRKISIKPVFHRTILDLSISWHLFPFFVAVTVSFSKSGYRYRNQNIRELTFSTERNRNMVCDEQQLHVIFHKPVSCVMWFENYQQQECYMLWCRAEEIPTFTGEIDRMSCLVKTLNWPDKNCFDIFSLSFFSLIQSMRYIAVLKSAHNDNQRQLYNINKRKIIHYIFSTSQITGFGIDHSIHNFFCMLLDYC